MALPKSVKTAVVVLLTIIVSSEWFPLYASNFITTTILSNTPKEALSAYYNELNRKNFTKAYDVYSEELKIRKSLRGLVSNASNSIYTMETISNIFTSNDFSIQKVSLNVSSGSINRKWKGPIYFKREGFSWKIYKMNEMCRVSRDKGKNYCYKPL